MSVIKVYTLAEKIIGAETRKAEYVNLRAYGAFVLVVIKA